MSPITIIVTCHLTSPRRSYLPEWATGEPVLLGWQTAILSNDLYAITRLASINKIIIGENVHWPRQLSSRCLLRHLLYHNKFSAITPMQFSRTGLILTHLTLHFTCPIHAVVSSQLNIWSSTSQSDFNLPPNSVTGHMWTSICSLASLLCSKLTNVRCVPLLAAIILWSAVNWTCMVKRSHKQFSDRCFATLGQRCGTVCLNSFGNLTSPLDNLNNRWKHYV